MSDSRPEAVCAGLSVTSSGREISMHIRRIAAAFRAGAFVVGLSPGLPQIARAAIVPDPSWNEIIAPDSSSDRNCSPERQGARRASPPSDFYGPKSS